MIPDVAYWLNYELLEAKVRYAAVNCSIEESTVRDRQSGLRPQDEFIRDNVTANDVIIMSVGGNDIALRPTLGTIFNTAWLVFASRQSNIEDGSAWGLQHFINLFRLQVLHFVRELTAKTKPKAVVICMIYFLDQNQGPDNRGWADGVLSKLGYFKNPRKLQALIRKVYALATESLRDNDLGVQIIPFPLFEVRSARSPTPSVHLLILSPPPPRPKVLDGTNSADYVQKVEPSSQGGRKMAQAFLKTLGDHKLV